MLYVVFPMDNLSRILMVGEFTQEIYVWYDYKHDCDVWYMKSYSMGIIDHYIMQEYNQEKYAWYYWEAGCDNWYMDSCHFGDGNHFHLLFDDSTPPYV
jgi:hypothetical protein